jgi:hypothetical protein
LLSGTSNPPLGERPRRDEMRFTSACGRRKWPQG